MWKTGEVDVQENKREYVLSLYSVFLDEQRLKFLTKIQVHFPIKKKPLEEKVDMFFTLIFPSLFSTLCLLKKVGREIRVQTEKHQQNFPPPYVLFFIFIFIFQFSSTEN